MWCVKDGVWKMVCNNVMCERRCVKYGLWRCVKDGVCQCGVWKMVCERWCVTKLVCDKMVCDKIVCDKDGAWHNKGGCRQVPGLPCKTTVDVTKCHACHVKRRWMSPNATPATQSAPAAASPATNTDPSAPPSAISATSATQNDRGCEIVPRLPRKVPQMWVCATPATQNDGRCDMWKMVCKDGLKMVCDRGGCERWCVTKLYVKDGVWQSCVWKMVCDKVVCEIWCVTNCVWNMMCDKVVCERWCVTKLCRKDGVLQSCVWKMVCDKVVCERSCVTKLYVKDGVWQSCVGKMVVGKERRREEVGGGGEATRDTESKTRTPHKVVGNYLTSSDPHPGKLHTDRIACDMARAHWCPQWR